jgi:hypothetical protein
MDVRMKRCPQPFIALVLVGACALAILGFTPSASSADITGCCFGGVCGNKSERSCRASGGTPLDSTCTSSDDRRCAKVCCRCPGAAVARSLSSAGARLSDQRPLCDGSCPTPQLTPTPTPGRLRCGFANTGHGDDDDDAADGPQCRGACPNAGERCLLLESTAGTRDCRCAKPCGLDPSTNMCGGVCPDPRKVCLPDDEDHECHCRRPRRPTPTRTPACPCDTNCVDANGSVGICRQVAGATDCTCQPVPPTPTPGCGQDPLNGQCGGPCPKASDQCTACTTPPCPAPCICQPPPPPPCGLQSRRNVRRPVSQCDRPVYGVHAAVCLRRICRPPPPPPCGLQADGTRGGPCPNATTSVRRHRHLPSPCICRRHCHCRGRAPTKPAAAGPNATINAWRAPLLMPCAASVSRHRHHRAGCKRPEPAAPVSNATDQCTRAPFCCPAPCICQPPPPPPCAGCKPSGTCGRPVSQCDRPVYGVHLFCLPCAVHLSAVSAAVVRPNVATSVWRHVCHCGRRMCAKRHRSGLQLRPLRRDWGCRCSRQ